MGAKVQPAAAGQRPERALLRSTTVSVALFTVGAATLRVQVGPADVHLALPTRADRLDPERNPHLGSIVGRYGNRIANARFSINEEEVELVPNEGPHQLHGGPDGFDRRTWELLGVDDDGPLGGAAAFGLTSPDGDQGYPGELKAVAIYHLRRNLLTIDLQATTDDPTVVNLVHHAYWNLGFPEGRGPAPELAPTIHDHVLQVHAREYLPVGFDRLAGPGGLSPVRGTAFDLRKPTRLGDVLDNVPPGIDHSFAIDGPEGELRPAARLSLPSTGRWLEVETDQPALHVYTGHKLREPFAPFQAVSLEAQRFPDTPNRPDLGSARLDPGELYRSRTRIRFGRD